MTKDVSIVIPTSSSTLSKRTTPTGAEIRTYPSNGKPPRNSSIFAKEPSTYQQRRASLLSDLKQKRQTIASASGQRTSLVSRTRTSIISQRSSDAAAIPSPSSSTSSETFHPSYDKSKLTKSSLNEEELFTPSPSKTKDDFALDTSPGRRSSDISGNNRQPPPPSRDKRPSTAANVSSGGIENSRRRQIKRSDSAFSVFSSTECLVYSSRFHHDQSTPMRFLPVFTERKRIADRMELEEKKKKKEMFPNETNAELAKLNEQNFLQQKRRCAKTFEEMIFVRISEHFHSGSGNGNGNGGEDRIGTMTNHTTTNNDSQAMNDCNKTNGLQKLLDNGIIQSVISLCSIQDTITQNHCARALYYLSRTLMARKLMVSSGIIPAIKILSRNITQKTKQDLAAILCHLTEEDSHFHHHNLGVDSANGSNVCVETLLYEGIDRALLRLYNATQIHETKRICALALVNLSCDASRLKHYVDSFSKVLLIATKNLSSSNVHANLIKALYNVSLISVFHPPLLMENVHRFLINQLPSVPENIQVLAVKALICFSVSKVNRKLIFSEALLRHLANFLLPFAPVNSSHTPTPTTANSPSPSYSPKTRSRLYELREGAAMLLVLLSIEDANRVQMARIGALIRAMVETITNVGVSFGTFASNQKTNLCLLMSYVFRNLTDTFLTHEYLVQAGIGPVLLELARLEHIQGELKTNAIGASCSILYSSSSSEMEIMAFVQGIVEEILTLSRMDEANEDVLHQGEHQSVVFAFRTLYHLSGSEDCLLVLFHHTELLNLVLEKAFSPNDEVKALIAAIIFKWASIQSTRKTMIQKGFLKICLHLLRNTTGKETSFAMHAIYLLAHENEEDELNHKDDNTSTTSSNSNSSNTITTTTTTTTTRSIECEFPNGTEQIAELTRTMSEILNPSSSSSPGYSPKKKQKEKKPSNNSSSSSSSLVDPLTLQNGISLLAFLAKNPLNRKILLKNDVIRFLRKLVHTSTDDIVLTNAAFVFFRLTATYDCGEILIKEEGIPVLIDLSRKSHPEVKEFCMLAICQLSSYLGFESKLIEFGAVSAVMIMAMVATDRLFIKALCVKTLANCLVAKNCVRPLIDHGVLWAITSLSTLQCHETRLACAVSLCNLSSEPHMISRFLDAGAPKALLALLQTKDPQVQLVVIKTIANLVSNEKLCTVFMNEDIQNHFNSIFQEQELFIIEEARQLSAMILLRVTSANDAMTLETLKKYLFSWMEQVIYMKEDHLVRNCLLTIQDLTCASSSICQELDIHQLLSIWVQIVEKNNKHGQNEEIQSLCLWILYNLSCQVQFLSFLARIEVMTFLRNCIPEKKVGTGTGAITENNTGNTVSKFTINVVPTTTVTGTSTSSSNDFKLAGFILHNLSCSNLTGNEDLLAPLVNLSAIAILRDISLHREDLQEICALAICNFCIGKVNSTRVLHENGGHVLLNFMSTSFFKAHHYRLFAASLRKLVTPPGNQTVMLEAGVVKTFVHLLKFPDIDAESQRNVLATICLLSKCSKYLVRLLDDGILPILISIAENHARNAGILAYCFEILSNLCAVNFEKYVNRSEINVVACLSKLSEHSMSMKIEDNSHSYYERGNGKPIPNPHLLVSMMRTPSNNIKKNLEVQGTYTAPTRKWIPEANITPKPPTTPLCEEVRLTESSHAIPEPIKKKIQGFLPLRKEKLYRDESNEEQSVSHPSLKSIANTVALSRATSAKKESS